MENNTVSSETLPAREEEGGLEPTVAVHPSVRAKARLSPGVTLEQIAAYAAAKKGEWKSAGKPGVYFCSIPKEWVRGTLRTLRPGEILDARVSFTPRPGVSERPRLEVRLINCQPDPVAAADIILYSAEALGDQRTSNCNFEIAAVRGLSTAEGNPAPPLTVFRNVICREAGDETGGTPYPAIVGERELLDELISSHQWWEDKLQVE